MKIYTKTGDTGMTGLFGGRRVSKDDPRVEAYGAIDELNACLGVAVSVLGDDELRKVVQRIQKELFVTGSDLATPIDQAPGSTATSNAPRVTDEMVLRLEAEIDNFTGEVGPLSHFILPGGAHAGAIVHQARCICRRAERCVTRLAAIEPVNRSMQAYVNRLSDHLFELARLINYRLGVPETIWSRDDAA